ncbi:MAG: sulfotransferase domain-containing protein [Phycisphaerales bacterium]
MPNIWISSYPKSGNTWVRFMLYAAIYGPPTISGDVPAKIPDIHRKLPTDLDPTGPLLIKSHFELTDQHPLIEDTLKAIHIIRNPRDVLLSALNYRKLGTDSTFPITNKRYAKSFLSHKGDPGFKGIGFGTWASQARSWRSTTKFPVLKLSYEQLKEEPESQLRAMLEFIQIERSEEQIKQALSASSFDAMRAMEIREKNNEKLKKLGKRFFVGTTGATRKGVYFMNKGESNQSLDTIYNGLDAQFAVAFKDELAEFGY